jgi:hypothetical protein
MRRALLAVAGLVVVVLIVAQIVLPRVAARNLRDGLERHGSDVRVSVKAVPAIKLLWHRADRVTVRVGHLRPGGPGSGKSLPDMLADTKAADELDVRVDLLDAQQLRGHDGRHRRRAAVPAADLRPAGRARPPGRQRPHARLRPRARRPRADPHRRPRPDRPAPRRHPAGLARQRPGVLRRPRRGRRPQHVAHRRRLHRHRARPSAVTPVSRGRGAAAA